MTLRTTRQRLLPGAGSRPCPGNRPGWMISMSFSKRSLVAMSEAVLIAAGGGLAAWYSPPLDPLAIVCVVLLARFRGRSERSLGLSRLACRRSSLHS
jgi:hypothetical protein